MTVELYSLASYYEDDTELGSEGYLDEAVVDVEAGPLYYSCTEVTVFAVVVVDEHAAVAVADEASC